MKKARLTWPVRILMIVGASALAIAMFVPLWRIELSAPQYPEGLNLLIYPGKLAGNVDIINGLNHYIGMKTLHSSDFMEFTLLPYLIFFFALFAALVALLGKPKILYLFFMLFICFGILAMVDFWRWEYNYGHDLNPDAAIIVPGMAYQPPLIGYKQLLNFGAYSIPDIGGWLFVFVGLITALSIGLTWKQNKNKIIHLAQPVLLVMSILCLSSCSPGPMPIKTGSDNCQFCKMTIVDPRYGAEVITQKGRIYKFDDSHCLLAWMKTNEVPAAEIKNTYLTNFNSDHQLLNVSEALMWQSRDLRGPMGGNLAACKEADSLVLMQQQFPGTQIQWKEIIKQ